MSITGSPDGEPQKVGVALVDVLAGLFATVGILAALRHRDATGEGQRVEVDLLSALLAALVNQGSAYTIAGRSRRGSATPTRASRPTSCTRRATANWSSASATSASSPLYARCSGRPELASDPRFATNGDRVAHRDALKAELLERLAKRRAATGRPRLRPPACRPARSTTSRGAFALAERSGWSRSSMSRPRTG